MRVKSALWAGILGGLCWALMTFAVSGVLYAAPTEQAEALALVATSDSAGASPGLGTAQAAVISLAFWPGANPSLLSLVEKTPRLLLPPMTERPPQTLAETLAAWPVAVKTERCAVRETLLSALAELRKLPQTPRLVLLLCNDEKAAPCDLPVSAFREAQSRLAVILLRANENAVAWQDLALQSGGHFADCRHTTAGDNCLLQNLQRIYPDIELDAPYFNVDKGTTKLTLLAYGERGLSVKLQPPQGPPLDLTSRIIIPGGKARLAQPTAVGQLLSVADPPPGAWHLNYLGSHSPWYFREKKQAVEVVMPRAEFFADEALPLAVYIKTRGQIRRDSAAFKDVGCEARLFARREGEGEAGPVASVPLLDNGKAPDKVSGDGVFSATVPLTGLLGTISLDVSCESSLFIGHARRTFTVRAGSFLKRENATQDLTAGLSGSLLFSAPELTAGDGPTHYFIQLVDEEPQALVAALGKPGYYAAGLIPLEAGVYPLKLIAQRGETPLLDDRQETTIKLRVAPDPDRQKARRNLWIGLGLVAALVVGLGAILGAYLVKRRKQSAKPFLFKVPEAESAPSPASTPAVAAESAAASKAKAPSAESSFLRMDDDDDVEMPSNFGPPDSQSKVFVEDVSQRISEVVSVHAGEPIKADMDRPTLDQQALDNDGDSSLVSGLMMEKVKSWLDKKEESEAEAAPAAPATPAQPKEASEEDGAFKTLDSNDLDDIFGAKTPPVATAKNEDDEKPNP